MTSEKEKAVYLGRFQPATIKHLNILETLFDKYPNFSISIGIASLSGERSVSNFLTGNEAVNAMQLSLVDRGFDSRVLPVEISEGGCLVTAVGDFLERMAFSVAISGSPKTLKALETIRDDRLNGLSIIRLDDDDQTGIRARMVRDGLRGQESSWKELVTPTVALFLDTQDFRDRIRRLPMAQKRPWN